MYPLQFEADSRDHIVIEQGDRHDKVLTSFPTDFEMTSELGRGGEATVNLYQSKRCHLLVAVKCIKTKRNCRDILREYRILSSISAHANVINAFGFIRSFPSPARQAIVLPYYEHGNLEQFRHDHSRTKGKVPESLVYSIFDQLAHGLQHIHSLGIIHGDLKPSDILISWMNKNSTLAKVKISDFGAATHTKDASIEDPRMKCTFAYAPPEMYLSESGDVWGLGAVVYFLCMGIAPHGEQLRTTMGGHLGRGKQQHEQTQVDTCESWYYQALKDYRKRYPVYASRVDKHREPGRNMYRYSTRLADLLSRALELEEEERILCDDLVHKLEVQRELRDLKAASWFTGQKRKSRN